MLFHYFKVIIERIHLGIVFIPLGTEDGTIANILIATIMMYSVFESRGLWFKLLNNKLMEFIGILSYSIYIWQQFFICKTSYWVNSYPFNLLILIFVAWGSYTFIEKPFLKLKERFTIHWVKSRLTSMDFVNDCSWENNLFRYIQIEFKTKILFEN